MLKRDCIFICQHIIKCDSNCIYSFEGECGNDITTIGKDTKCKNYVEEIIEN
jgi:hypothetical protein